MLLDSDKSAEPPIMASFFSTKLLIIFSEDFLVAIGSRFLIIFCFSISKIFLKSCEKVSSIRLFFLLYAFSHFISFLAALLPISLHSFKIFSGIIKGSWSHFYFFLTKIVSSFPKGFPWVEAVPDLFGDPYPIVVLQEIVVGRFAF